MVVRTFHPTLFHTPPNTEEDMVHAMWMPIDLWRPREEHNVLVGTEELETFLAIANAQRSSSEHVKDQTPITREDLNTFIYPDLT